GRVDELRRGRPHRDFRRRGVELGRDPARRELERDLQCAGHVQLPLRPAPLHARHDRRALSGRRTSGFEGGPGRRRRGPHRRRHPHPGDARNRATTLGGVPMVNEIDLKHLRRCVELAAEVLAAGGEPFGFVLVSGAWTVLAEDRNRIASGDPTRHPEFALARWAAEHLTPEERAAATVYTSGEHCPMCAAAHGWVGLGRIVYVASAAQLAEWLAEFGVPPSP